MKNRGGNRHERAGGDEAGNFVFGGFRHVERLFQGGWNHDAGGVLQKTRADEQHRGHEKQRIGEPRQLRLLLRRFGLVIIIRADRADAEHRRNRHAGDQGDGLAQFFRRRIRVGGLGGGVLGAGDQR